MRIIAGTVLKYTIGIFLIINIHSCSTVEMVTIHQDGAFIYQADDVTIPETDPVLAEAASESDDIPIAEAVIESNAPPISELAENEMASSDDECGCEAVTEDNASSEQEYAEVRNPDPKFYSKYSKKLGIGFDGTEDKELIMAVDNWLGTRYKWGGCSRRGIDCSCFVQAVYRDVYGIELNRTSKAIFYNDLVPVRKKELRQGDIICFKMKGDRISHIGIYLKDNKFAHVIRKTGVTIGDLSARYYKKRFFGAGRVKGIDTYRMAKGTNIPDAPVSRSRKRIVLSRLVISDSLYDTRVNVVKKKSKCPKHYQASASTPTDKG
jgi:cell wall-associated NlpC family hydrolase